MSQAFENLITKIDNRYSSFVEFEEFDYNEKLVEEVYFMLYWLDNHGIDLSKYESNNLEDSDGRFLGIEYSTEMDDGNWLYIEVLFDEENPKLDEPILRLFYRNNDEDYDYSILELECDKSNRLKIAEYLQKIEKLMNVKDKDGVIAYMKELGAKCPEED